MLRATLALLLMAALLGSLPAAALLDRKWPVLAAVAAYLLALPFLTSGRSR